MDDEVPPSVRLPGARHELMFASTTLQKGPVPEMAVLTDGLVRGRALNARPIVSVGFVAAWVEARGSLEKAKWELSHTFGTGLLLAPELLSVAFALQSMLEGPVEGLATSELPPLYELPPGAKVVLLSHSRFWIRSLESPSSYAAWFPEEFVSLHRYSLRLLELARQVASVELLWTGREPRDLLDVLQGRQSGPASGTAIVASQVRLQTWLRSEGLFERLVTVPQELERVFQRGQADWENRPSAFRSQLELLMTEPVNLPRRRLQLRPRVPLDTHDPGSRERSRTPRTKAQALSELPRRFQQRQVAGACRPCSKCRGLCREESNLFHLAPLCECAQGHTWLPRSDQT